MLAYILQGTSWYVSLKTLDLHPPYISALKTYFISIMGKYIPGKVFMVISRMYLFKQYKKNHIVLLSFFIEQSLFLLSIIIFLALSTFWVPVNKISVIYEYKYIFVLLFVLIIVVLIPRNLYFLMNKFSSAYNKLLKKDIDFKVIKKIKISNFYKIILIDILNWLILGLALFIFINSFFNVDLKNFFIFVNIYAIASFIGLISVFAPSGIGVREGIMAFLFNYFVSPEVALIIPIMARLWATCIEIMLFLMFLLLARKTKY